MVQYKMLARDVNAEPVQYRTWVVDGAPDFTGQFYTGDKSGPNPFVDVSAYAIVNPADIVNFNLPDPLDWDTTYQTLPNYTCDAQLAVIDGYIYLFGGQNSNKILIASVDNPATFTDTGATLPVALAGSQIAIINGTIYLFGGTTTASFGSATDIILSAPVSNPLNWTNNGSLLPVNLHHSQLTIIENTIYLLGGCENNQAIPNIFAASVSNPLLWIDTGLTLPTPLYGSQVGLVDGYAYLFGGLTAPNIPTALILSASLSDLSTWLPAGALPYSSYYGQFCTIGGQGYLFAATVSNATSYTKILRCNLSNPGSWVDTQSTVGGCATQSHLAIVYDRMWLYGGSGSTVILANNSVLAYNPDDPSVQQYANITRTQVQEAPTQIALFQVLGFPPWKTDYGS